MFVNKEKKGSERYAIYFTLVHADPLYQLAAQWLEYDLYDGRSAIQIDHRELLIPLAPYSDYNAQARIYGFHATLKPPFRLNPGISRKQLKKILKHFVRLHQPFECAALKVEQIGNFLALVPEQNCQQLDRLARGCVQTFEVFRAPLTEQELARRKPESLTPRQRLLLQHWGYPYVLEEYRFHMTLTDRLSQTQIAICKPVLENYFQPYLKRPLQVNQVSLCYQENNQLPFKVVESYTLGLKHK